MRVAVHGQYVDCQSYSDIQGYSDKGVHTLCEGGSPRTVCGMSELL